MKLLIKVILWAVLFIIVLNVGYHTILTVVAKGPLQRLLYFIWGSGTGFCFGHLLSRWVKNDGTTKKKKKTLDE